MLVDFALDIAFKKEKLVQLLLGAALGTAFNPPAGFGMGAQSAPMPCHSQSGTYLFKSSFFPEVINPHMGRRVMFFPLAYAGDNKHQNSGYIWECVVYLHGYAQGHVKTQNG